MKSREARRHEAWRILMWVIGAVAVLVLLYFLIGGIPGVAIAGLGPWLGASVGASLAYILTRRQHREADDQRRQALATLLLFEISQLEGRVRAIVRDPPNLFDLAKRSTGFFPIDSHYTATYDSAGASLLLFSPETVYALSYFYRWIYFLRPQLDYINTQVTQDPKQKMGRDFGKTLDDILAPRLPLTTLMVVAATEAAQAVPEAAARLRDEGGKWPRPLPTESEYANLPPPVFEVNR